MSTTRRKLQEIEAETRYITIDRLLFLLFTLLSTALAMVFVASAIPQMFVGISQALQHVVAVPH